MFEEHFLCPGTCSKCGFAKVWLWSNNWLMFEIPTVNSRYTHRGFNTRQQLTRFHSFMGILQIYRTPILVRDLFTDTLLHRWTWMNVKWTMIWIWELNMIGLKHLWPNNLRSGNNQHFFSRKLRLLLYLTNKSLLIFDHYFAPLSHFASFWIQSLLGWSRHI